MNELTKWECSLSGELGHLDYAAAVMLFLGDALKNYKSQGNQTVITRKTEDERFEIGNNGIGKIADGKLEVLDLGADLMFQLAGMLFASDEKIRVTIDRNPDSGQFEITREILTQ